MCRNTKVWTAISLSSHVSKSVVQYSFVFVLRKTRRKTLSRFLPPVCLLARCAQASVPRTGRWEGVPLGKKDFVICADEKSQLQILAREFATLPPDCGKPIRMENDYKRTCLCRARHGRKVGTVAYLSALDVFSGHIFGRVDEKTGIVPFQKLVDLVMEQEPYACADRVFWIVDNGSSHYTTTFP